jgi:uncharacterized membrane protein
MENHTRSIVKTFSYRTVVGISLFLTALAMNHSAGFGLTFVILSYTVGFAAFWLHERVWNRFNWGRDGTYETKRRSVAKTITWRIWAFIILYVNSLILGLSSNDALEWTIVTNILFIVVHYLHERVWNLIQWGKTIKRQTV